MSRECHCPEWVIRCAHLPDGTVMRLGKAQLVPSPTARRTWRKPFAIDRSLVVPCSEHRRLDCGCFELAKRFDSEADALAAFYEAERELIGAEA